MSDKVQDIQDQVSSNIQDAQKTIKQSSTEFRGTIANLPEQAELKPGNESNVELVKIRRPRGQPVEAEEQAQARTDEVNDGSIIKGAGSENLLNEEDTNILSRPKYRIAGQGQETGRVLNTSGATREVPTEASVPEDQPGKEAFP